MKSLAYFKLLSNYFLALEEIRRLKAPPIPEEIQEKRMLQIQSFCSEGNLSQRALTAANLYNAEFFATIDPVFGKKVAIFLVEYFSNVSGLIEASFQLWESKV